jgi:hypothetical protein
MGRREGEVNFTVTAQQHRDLAGECNILRVWSISMHNTGTLPCLVASLESNRFFPTHNLGQSPMTQAQFKTLIAQVSRIFAACKAAIADGWMCNREAGGIRYGRVIKPDPALGGSFIVQEPVTSQP